MPDNYDINDSIYMLEVLDEMQDAKTFLLRMFFPESVEYQKTKVIIDIIKGSRRVSPYVTHREEGNLVERDGSYTNEIEAPAMKPKMGIDMVDLDKRYPGEIPVNMDPNNPNHQEKYARIRAKDLQEMDNQNTRSLELQASEGLFTGKIQLLDIEGKKVLADVDFLRNPENTIITDGDPGKEGWDNADSDPDVQIFNWKAIALKNSGVLPNTGVLGDTARSALLQNEKALKKLDTRRYDNGAISIIEREAGVQFIGRMSGVDLWNYSEWYEHPVTGDLTPMVPPDHFLLGSTNAQNKILYALINHIDLTKSAIPLKKYAVTYTTKDPSREYLQLYTSPIAACNQADAFVDINVIEGA